MSKILAAFFYYLGYRTGSYVIPPLKTYINNNQNIQNVLLHVKNKFTKTVDVKNPENIKK